MIKTLCHNTEQHKPIGQMAWEQKGNEVTFTLKLYETEFKKLALPIIDGKDSTDNRLNGSI